MWITFDETNNVIIISHPVGKDYVLFNWKIRLYICFIFFVIKRMYLDNPSLQRHKAEVTKKKWEDLVFGDELFVCKKCEIAKHPTEFVVHRIDNYRVGKYRYLHECKQCKRNRVYWKRSSDRETIQWALGIIIKQLEQWAKKRKISFDITVSDLLALREQQEGKCYYTWYGMKYEFIHYKQWRESDKTRWQISCDRIDNALWYENNNIVLCCIVANKMKSTLSQKEFYQICKDIISNHL